MPTDPASTFLAGAVVQRARFGASCVRLRLRTVGETLELLLTAEGAGIVSPRSIAATPSPSGSGQRSARLVGARVVAVCARAVTLEREGAVFHVVWDATSSVETMREGAALDAPCSREELASAGERLAASLVASDHAAWAALLEHAIERAKSRVERRRDAVRGDLEKAEKAAESAANAALFVAVAATAPRGSCELVAVDWSSGEPVSRSLPIDPSRSARESLDAVFRRARRLKLGAPIATRRLDEATKTLSELSRLLEELDRVRVLEAPSERRAGFAAIEAKARATAPRELRLGAAPLARAPERAPSGRRLPFRTFLGSGESKIRVGRSAAESDELTTRVARPHHLFLHVRGHAGAHVLVELDKGKACPPDLLVDAAHLAAHFSSVQGEPTVEVQSTPRRYVRKPRGSAPGLVILDREKTMLLRVDGERIQRLLTREIV